MSGGITCFPLVRKESNTQFSSNLSGSQNWLSGLDQPIFENQIMYTLYMWSLIINFKSLLEVILITFLFSSWRGFFSVYWCVISLIFFQNIVIWEMSTCWHKFKYLTEVQRFNNVSVSKLFMLVWSWELDDITEFHWGK